MTIYNFSATKNWVQQPARTTSTMMRHTINSTHHPKPSTAIHPFPAPSRHKKCYIMCKYSVPSCIPFFAMKNRAQRAQEQNQVRARPTGTTCLIGKKLISFGTVYMLSRLLLLTLGRQNIPDGCNEPCYPQNIQFPAPQQAQW